MIRKTPFGEYVINGLYKHYKGDFYYRLHEISKLHDSQNIYIIHYSRCDENGIYISIRTPLHNGDEEIVWQPFSTHETRWHDEVVNAEGKQVKRFTFIKQL